MSAPQSTIYICAGVHLDNRFDHTIRFATRTAQHEYFAGKVIKTFSAYTFLRKNWSLQVRASFADAQDWTYLYFKNWDGKHYYYFINQVQYKNDFCVELELELDVIQTYMHDWRLLDCFVERQHTTTDNLGEYTLDEGLETGELITYKKAEFPLRDMCILILSSINPNYTGTGTPVPVMPSKYDNVFSGLKIWAVDMENSESWHNWSSQLQRLSEAGFIDGIVTMWMYPKALVQLGGENTWEDDVLCKAVDSAKTLFFDIPASSFTTVDGYAPKNKKLFSYPFNLLCMSNNNGSTATYRFERFDNYGTQSFMLTGVLSPEASMFCMPTSYNGLAGNWEEGLMSGSFPTCAWNADVYKLWLAQNQNQLSHATNSGVITAGFGAAAAVGSAFTGNIVGAAGALAATVSGYMQTRGVMAQKADMAIQPPQARGHFSSSMALKQQRQTFFVYFKSVDAEHARAIDNYFTMYGYKLGRVQKPNIFARKAFTYVKTIGCKIAGNINTEDLVKIESIFDRGITFWEDGDNLGDYSVDNSV